MQPTGTPILVTITATNQGDTPVICDVRVSYPKAGLFQAKITDAQGRVRELFLCKGEISGGSGRFGQLKPGASLDVPGWIEPLPVGFYTIQVGQGKSAKVTIKDHIDVARKWDEDLLLKIRSGDPFANDLAYVCLRDKYARPSFIDGLLGDLSSDSEVEVERAASTLNRATELPAKAGAIIIRAMKKRLQLVKEGRSTKTWVLGSLAAMSAQIGTDEALESVIALARTKEVRGNAIWALGKFQQEKAALELRLFLNDQNEEFQFRAAQTLSERKDAKALEVLLAVAHDPKSRWRMYSFDALLKYPGDPRVEPAIKSGLNDADTQVRQSAEFALRQLANQKKQKP